MRMLGVMQMLLNDIPYLEPLWKWLRDDESLKEHFTEDSFFMPKATLMSAIDAAMGKDCPSPKSIWIIPGDTLAISKSNTNKICKLPGEHTFNIMIFVQCIRDSFSPVNDNGVLRLEGQFMELSELRKIVKDSIHKFALNNEKINITSKKFEGPVWSKDVMFYPAEDKFLVTGIEYQVTIFP